MKPFDTAGRFWLLNHEELVLPGRLHFDPNEGIELSLIGRFEYEGVDTGDAATRILGVCDSGRVTLNRVFFAGETSRSSGLNESRYRANQLFVGHHFTEPTIEVTAATTEFTRLSDWVNETGITKTFDPRDPTSNRPSRYSVSCTATPAKSGSFSRGQVILNSHWQEAEASQHSVQLNFWHSIRIEYQAPQRFDLVQGDVARIQSLITMCTDSFAAFTRFMVESPDADITMLDGTRTDIKQPIEFIATTIHSKNNQTRTVKRNLFAFVTFTEAGGVETIARWLDRAESFQRPLNVMMSIRHNAQMYVENKFLNVMQAAEAYHQITQGSTHTDNETFTKLVQDIIAATPTEHQGWLEEKIRFINTPSLNKRMRQLARSAGPGIRGLIRNVDHWSFTVAGARNELTHLGKKSGSIIGTDLYHLSESVYIVIRNCMLLEAGVPETELSTKVDSHALMRHADQLQRSIQRVRQQLREP
ncbi:HEPN domain-containing protein [Amycolatopsis kentuckyensis]|uniref:ApeA N-terminal domain 1-containing protein n=1 Tax=Amycolatopsis kentuckyensis TaxID=218823 RepID=UPI0011781337|nr:HEPN domain-containing protein [Amycolatopsis kentuckyensis]